MNWDFITFFGDSTLLVPTAILMFLVFCFSSHGWIVAKHWILTFCTVGFFVCLSKIAFMGWGIGSKTFDFTGISGHTALSSTFWPVFLWISTKKRSQWICMAGRILGISIPLIVGFSRLMVNAHSSSEVIIGWFVGFSASAFFLNLQKTNNSKQLSTFQLAALMFTPFLLIKTETKAPATEFLEHISVMISSSQSPFTRNDLNNIKSSKHSLPSSNTLMHP